MKRAWTVAAARNNARWCDAVCFSRGKPGRFLEHIWVNAEPVPRFYPNAVTLSRADVTEQRKIVRILLKSHLPGRWSVKDSFYSLDIARLGFEVLLEARWIRNPAPAIVEPASDLVWERATHGDDAFHPSLFSDANFAMFSGRRGASVVAGGTLYKAEHVVGVSNVVADADDAVAVWRDLSSLAARTFPGVPLVGYESGDELKRAHEAGFQLGESLRVWVSSRD